ncbi:MAG: hypothetical protein R2791_09075 [Saprospiraceae bacterium]
MPESAIPASAPTEKASVATPSYSGAALEWLSALPNEPVKADLTAIDADLAISCVHELVENGKFEMTVKSNFPAGDWLNHFYFEARNREKVFGTKNLGIGYPFVMAKMAGYELAAPLFIWQFQLEPHAQHVDEWSVVHNESHSAVPNYPFFHLLDAVHGTDFSRRAQQLTEGKSLNSRSFDDICEGVRLMLGLVEDGLPLSIQPFPADARAKEYLTEGRLVWSAVAGIFPTLPRTTVTHPPTVAPDLPAEGADWKHTFTMLPLDPSQRSVLHAMQHNALTVVEGTSGTGKTYLISSIVINALSHGKKCLVVSKSINALRRAQKFLLEKGFGDVSFVIRDIAGDQLMLADMLRMATENKNKALYNEEMFKTVLNKTQREQRKLDDAWEELHAPLFGDLNFTDTVGKYLRANRIEGKELLLSYLHPQDFEFSKKEFDGIVEAIYASEPLFRRFPTLSHPLGRLNESVFLAHDSEQGRQWTEMQVKSLLGKATALHHRYISKTNDYAESLLDHYEQYYFELSAFVKRIRDGLEDGVQRFGSDFEKPISATEKLYGVFSDRYKEIVAAKEKIGATFDEMRRSYGLRKYFDFDFPNHFDSKNIKKISELTKDFEASMRLWRRRIPSVVREDVRRLNAKSIHADLDFREQIKELEYAMDVFLEEFNSMGLYADHLKHEMLTIPKRQEFLEDVIARLEETQFYLRDFEDFYIWQKHWLGLRGPEQKVVRALCKIKPNNWLAAFESWYLHHLLQNEFNPGMQWNDDLLETLDDNLRELRQLLPFQISALWQNRKNKALRALKSADGTAFKTWFGKNNRTLSATHKAEELFQKHIQPLTETLPVLLVTPQVALDVVQLSNMTFDVVLVDEAHNIPKQECYHLFEMAKNLVVFGDSKQDMTPFAEDDFLEFCQGIGAKTHQLEYQHQDSPEEWVRFNKIAFGTPYKRLPSGRIAREATVVANVEGRYDESSGTNEAEARQIIDWLNLIEPTAARSTYPVVGIACSTVQQRDLIAGQLLKIRQRKQPGFEKIQQMLLSGLGVYQFAELQGQHVDMLLISLTHGTTDAQGSLTRHLHFWNTQLGLNQLHVVLTRATQKLFIAHSIPPGLHSVLAADRNFLGTCILSHLVTFAEHLQRGEGELAEEQLQKMKGLLNYTESYYPFSTFMEEVEFALRPYFEASQLKRNALAAGVRVPLFLEAKNEKEASSVLFFDGVLAKSAMPSYEWEEKMKRFFHQSKIEVVPTLSVQWWKSPKQEARKLASRLLRGEEK